MAQTALNQNPPNWKPGASRERLLEQQARIQGRIAAGKGNPKRSARRLDRVNSALSQFPEELPPAGEGAGTEDPAPQNQPTPAGWENAGSSALEDLLNEIRSSGPFNPGDYSEQRQRAEQAVMSSFERSNQARWAREEENFRSRMAAQGVPEGSEAYNQRYQMEIGQPKQQAYQDAQDRSIIAGQAEQAQGFEQGLQRYQAPGDRLGQFNQFVQGQNAQNLERTAQQGRLDVLEADAGYKQELQKLIDSGQMSLQQAELKWKQRQNRYDRNVTRRGQDMNLQSTKLQLESAMQQLRAKGEIDLANSIAMIIADRESAGTAAEGEEDTSPSTGDSFASGLGEGASSVNFRRQGLGSGLR